MEPIVNCLKIQYIRDLVSCDFLESSHGETEEDGLYCTTVLDMESLYILVVMGVYNV